MSLFHIAILALVQGLTEFLPVSSSGHLILAHQVLGEPGEVDLWQSTLVIDVAVHVGTLFAVLLYFRRDIASIFKNSLRKDNRDIKMPLYIVLASIPVVITGYFIHKFEPSFIRSVEITAWATLIFGIVLGVADKYGRTERTIDKIGFKDALYIGLSQTLALIPGTSRSGITMSAARFLGFNRVDCAKFSLFLSIVAISGAGCLGFLDIIDGGFGALGVEVLWAIVLSFISGYAAISLMIKWLSKSSFKPFVYYRIIIGILLLFFIYS
jgi:undecaprenyl-diphosphatase